MATIFPPPPPPNKYFKTRITESGEHETLLGIYYYGLVVDGVSLVVFAPGLRTGEERWIPYDPTKPFHNWAKFKHISEAVENVKEKIVRYVIEVDGDRVFVPHLNPEISDSSISWILV